MISDGFLIKLDEYSKAVETEMQCVLAETGLLEDFAKTMSYSVMAGGKRLRPALVLATASLCGGDLKDALPFACAIEFIHTYSLIHDDLPALDNDDYRRGKLTCHKKFGEDKAILAGDGLLNFAFEIMLDACDTVNKIKAAKSIANAAGVKGMIAGQWVDVKLNGQSVDRETMEFIHLHKTADLIIGAVKAGAYSADVSQEKIEAITMYAKEIGYSFQIVDDILDVEGSMEDLGKAIGSDSANNKTTYVTLFGLDGAKREAEIHTKNAVKALEIFEEDTRFFKDLAFYLLTRKK